MPEQQLILIALLLTAAVMYGYFYFKRAQARGSGSPPTSPRTDSPGRGPTDDE